MVPGTAVLLFWRRHILAPTRQMLSTIDSAVIALTPRPRVWDCCTKRAWRRASRPASSTSSRAFTTTYFLRNCLFFFSVEGRNSERSAAGARERARSRASSRVSGRSETPEAATRTMFEATTWLGFALPLFLRFSLAAIGLRGMIAQTCFNVDET
jgi:hypothetical protein